MADDKDEIMGVIALGISQVYTILVNVCRKLPVPIGLPTDPHIPVEDAYPAIQRAADLAGEQPMGELQGIQLYAGCVHLLSAIDLYALCAARYMDTRADGASANLLIAEESLNALALWLVINEAD